MAGRFTADASSLSRTTGLFDSTNLTFCAWMRLSTIRAAESVLCDIATATPSHFFLFTGSDGKSMMISDNASINPTIVTMLVGRWYFIAGTKAGTNFIGYASPADGGLLTSVTGTSTATYTGNWSSFRIGKDEFTASTFPDGDIANVKVWTVALTREELMAEQFSGIPQRTLNLNAWYPIQGAQTGHIDFSGNANNLVKGATALLTEEGPPCGWF